jgi:gas vesicle protein
VTQFFENKEESTKRLMDALKGRPVYPGLKESEELMERVSKLREEIKAFREKHKIEDPPEHAAAKKEEEKEKK